MSGKSLPKPSSKTALNKKYQLLAIETKGRLDTATENGRANINLLQKYYNAFSNLYGAIILDDAWDIFKILEKEIISIKQIVKKDFLFFSEVARYEAHNYFVLEIDELYEAEERGSAARRFILNKKLYKKGYSSKRYLDESRIFLYTFFVDPELIILYWKIKSRFKRWFQKD